MKYGWGMLALFLSATAVMAQPMPLRPRGGVSPADATAPVDVQADNMTYHREAGLIEAAGRVTIRRGEDVLLCDKARVNVKSQEVVAEGRVLFTNALVRWEGESLTYNFATRQWKSGYFASVFEPFHVWADGAEAAGRSEYRLHDAVITTCTNDANHLHYAVTARKATVTPGESLKARHVVLWFGPVPVFYSPYWYRPLGDRTVGFGAAAGYRERMGAFLLTSTSLRLTPEVKTTTHLDYRTKRGAAVGQDLRWLVDGGSGKGVASVYYTHDEEFLTEQEGNTADWVDADRYRIRLSHAQPLGERDYMASDFTFLSDPYVLEDFFEGDYRSGFQPDNFAGYVYRGPGYSAGLTARMRLNDFFTAVERLPEGSLEFSRQPLAGGPFYYEGRHFVANLRKRYAKNNDNGPEDYEALRLDSANTVFYPMREFGFLNLIPRAGYRATSYSKTVLREDVTEVVWTVTTNYPSGSTGTPVFAAGWTTNSFVRETEAGGKIRSLFEMGLETSFQAFRTWENVETIMGDGLRHIVEPYANYTYIPEPNLTPEDLYQFDKTDALDKQHTVKLGLRNRFQTKPGRGVWDLLDLDVFTTYKIEDGGDRPFSHAEFKADVGLAEWLPIRVDGAYNPYDTRIEELNTRVSQRGTFFDSYIEHRYRFEDSNLLVLNVAYKPNRAWAFEAYERFEFEQSRLEEQGYFVNRTLDCLAFRFGVSHLPGYTRDNGVRREDEFRATVQMWLTAFPNIRVGQSRRTELALTRPAGGDSALLAED